MIAAMWASLTLSWSSQAVLVTLLLSLALLALRVWIGSSKRVLSRAMELSFDVIIIVFVLLFFFFVVVRFETLA